MHYEQSRKSTESPEKRIVADLEANLKKLQEKAFLDIIQRVELALQKERKI